MTWTSDRMGVLLKKINLPRISLCRRNKTELGCRAAVYSLTRRSQQVMRLVCGYATATRNHYGTFRRLLTKGIALHERYWLTRTWKRPPHALSLIYTSFDGSSEQLSHCGINRLAYFFCSYRASQAITRAANARTNVV
jgi:hypothetical protein